MEEKDLMLLTNYALVSVGKGYPKGFVLKVTEENVCEFLKYEEGDLCSTIMANL